VLALFQHLERRSALVVILAHRLGAGHAGTGKGRDQDQAGLLGHETTLTKLASCVRPSGAGDELLTYSSASPLVRAGRSAPPPPRRPTPVNDSTAAPPA